MFQIRQSPATGTQTVQADIFGNYTVVDFTGLATASDNCTASSPNRSLLHRNGPRGQLRYHHDADDVSLTGNCAFKLTVQAG
ncbi:MAG: hypothetical protein R2825_20065 [Saprospiraceae bacterium]